MPRAVVVGAGIGGLTAAVGLRRRGWDVVVLERAERFAPIGAGLVLQPNGFAGLDAVGLGETVRRTTRPLGAMVVRDVRGTRLLESRTPDAARSAGVHRATLHRLLADALPPGAVTLGAQVVAVGAGTDGHADPADARPDVTYRTGDEERTLIADLLVGADGVRSVVRSALWPEAPAPRDVGCTAWRGVTRTPEDRTAAEIAWGPGTEVGLVPLEDGRVYWYVSVTADRVPGDASSTTTADDHHDVVVRLVDGWYADVRRAVADTDPASVVRTDLEHLLPGPATYVRGRVALLGDAAHAMTPFVGQGANQAIEDAVVLAAVAGPDDDVAAALLRYDRARRPRATRTARAALRAGRVGQMVRSPRLVRARSAAMRLVPSALAGRAAARATRWTAPSVPVGR